MVMFMIADRFVDLVGLATIIYLTVKATLWVKRRVSDRGISSAK